MTMNDTKSGAVLTDAQRITGHERAYLVSQIEEAIYNERYTRTQANAALRAVEKAGWLPPGQGRPVGVTEEMTKAASVGLMMLEGHRGNWLSEDRIPAALEAALSASAVEGNVRAPGTCATCGGDGYVGEIEYTSDENGAHQNDRREICPSCEGATRQSLPTGVQGVDAEALVTEYHRQDGLYAPRQHNTDAMWRAIGTVGLTDVSALQRELEGVREQVSSLTGDLLQARAETKEARRDEGEARQLAEERLAHRNAVQAELEEAKRELEAARAETKRTLTEGQCMMAGSQAVKDQLTRERDEARSELERVKRELEGARRERDAYKRAKAENDERFMTERDGARSELERTRAERNAATERARKFSDRATEMERERDEARAQLAKRGDGICAETLLASYFGNRFGAEHEGDYTAADVQAMHYALSNVGVTNTVRLEAERDLAKHEVERLRARAQNAAAHDQPPHGGALTDEEVEAIARDAYDAIPGLRWSERIGDSVRNQWRGTVRFIASRLVARERIPSPNTAQAHSEHVDRLPEGAIVLGWDYQPSDGTMGDDTSASFGSHEEMSDEMHRHGESCAQVYRIVAIPDGPPVRARVVLEPAVPGEER